MVKCVMIVLESAVHVLDFDLRVNKAAKQLKYNPAVRNWRTSRNPNQA
jgi:hypothetical protein